MGEFKPVKLVSPNGNTFIARDARTFNDLRWGQNYKVVKDAPAPTPQPRTFHAAPAAADAEK